MSLQESTPKHRQIFEELQRQIVSGQYGPGQKLPSEQALVEQFGASRITVGRAVRDLGQEGLVERRAGSGTYVRASAAGSTSFGLLIPDLGQTDIFEPICQGMAEASEGAGHALLWCNVPPGTAEKSRHQHALELCDQYIRRAVSGVFFAPFEEAETGDSRANEEIVEKLTGARIPIVLLDRDYVHYPQRSPHDLVGIDNRRAGFMAADHLLELGHRRIGFLSYPRAATTVEERIAGYREAHFARETSLEHAFVARFDPENVEAVAEMMEQRCPTAMVCANDTTAGRLMQSLGKLGRRVPEDVSIVGIDDVRYASLLPVPLTTVRQPCREIGIAAMSAMRERARRPKMPTREIFVETKLIVRNSTIKLNRDPACGTTVEG